MDKSPAEHFPHEHQHPQFNFFGESNRKMTEGGHDDPGTGGSSAQQLLNLPAASPLPSSSSNKNPDRPLLFPSKLRKVLNDAEVHKSKRKDTAIAWLPDGKAFKIYNRLKFSTEVMPIYFGSCKPKSFQRNLNLWGFKGQDGMDGKGIWSHPLFQRDSPDLCLKMKRTVARRKGTQTAPKPPAEEKINQRSHSTARIDVAKDKKLQGFSSHSSKRAASSSSFSGSVSQPQPAARNTTNAAQYQERVSALGPAAGGGAVSSWLRSKLHQQQRNPTASRNNALVGPARKPENLTASHVNVIPRVSQHGNTKPAVDNSGVAVVNGEFLLPASSATRLLSSLSGASNLEHNHQGGFVFNRGAPSYHSISHHGSAPFMLNPGSSSILLNEMKQHHSAGSADQNNGKISADNLHHSIATIIGKVGAALRTTGRSTGEQRILGLSTTILEETLRRSGVLEQTPSTTNESPPRMSTLASAIQAAQPLLLAYQDQRQQESEAIRMIAERRLLLVLLEIRSRLNEPFSYAFF